MLSDEQFKEMIDKISRNQEDHDCLVRIETIVKINQEQTQKDMREFAIKSSKMELSIDKTHTRIDNEIKFRYSITGAAISIGGIIAVVGLILKLTGKI